MSTYNINSEIKTLYFKYIEEVRELVKFESPVERMRRWKEIFDKFQELCISSEYKQRFISISESLLKSKFSGTSLQVLETVNDEIKIPAEQFSLKKFAKKLKAKYTVENGIVDYIDLESAALSIIQQTPRCCFFYGIDLFSEIELRAKKPRMKRLKDPEGVKVKPSNVVNKRSDMPDNEVAVVLNALNKAYQKNNQNPIIYWLLVVDPDSFSKTVDNIFYVSFLIRENLAKMSLDADNILMIEPLSNRNVSGIKNDPNQAVISISLKNWEV
ncbi:SMC5-SMC6 complex kleisin component Non-SMC element 1 isoform X2 [Lycorma delicatula]|uniref:SMC5-SMC6 complex kleisin component Non-SMC element 1 isoform X2 n=1 Tax=Lycorma delicatula TaxID=130591 RepID=UPI003F516DB8